MKCDHLLAFTNRLVSVRTPGNRGAPSLSVGEVPLLLLLRVNLPGDGEQLTVTTEHILNV